MHADPNALPVTGEKTPNAHKRVEVSGRDLPLYCPQPGGALWSSHPRVYLPVAEQGEARCPYCSTLYVLKKTG